MTRTITEADQRAAAQSAAVPSATGEQLPPAMALLKSYWPQVSKLLPSHIPPAAWYSQVYAALYRGQDPSKNIDLWRCANRNPESLLFALMDAARQGLAPGTEQFYLTPRPNRKAKSGVEVLGIRGYQGEIELIYRAGAIASVIVETVRKNDLYRYRRGVDPMPVHEFDPWASHASRGPLVGVYAYGVFHGGAVSKVIELNSDDIAHARKKAPGGGTVGPWVTDEEAMWLKTGVHRLQKFVPTSAEYRHIEQLTGATATAVGAAHGDAARATLGAGPAGPAIPAGSSVVALAPGVGELPPPAVDMAPDAPGGDTPPLDPAQFAQPRADDDPDPEDNTPSEPEHHAPAVPTPKDLPTTFPAVTGTGDEPPAATGQQRAMGTLLGKAGVTDEPTRLALMARLAGRNGIIPEPAALTNAEARQVITLLGDWQDAGVLQVHVDAVRAVLPAAAPVDPAKLPERGTKSWHDQKHPVVQDGTVALFDVVLDGDCGICEQDGAGR